MTTSWFDGKARAEIDALEGQGPSAHEQWPRTLRLAFQLLSASDLPCLLILRDGLRVFGNRASNRTVADSTTILQGAPLADAGLMDLELPIRKVLHAGTSVVCHAQPVWGTGARRRNFDAYLSPVFDDDRTALAVFCALTPAKKVAAQKAIWTGNSSERTAAETDGRSIPSMLLSEMKHRVKNTLSMVHAIARLTLGVHQSPAYDAFEARILALARAQDLITCEPTESVDLGDLLALILAPHPRNAVDIAGQSLRISSGAAVTLSLGIHELATNALKYGALSVQTGASRSAGQLHGVKATQCA